MTESSEDENAIRLAVGSKVESFLPKGFGTEIAITGSASRGVAGSKSDLELNIWSSNCPPRVSERKEWLERQLHFLPRIGAEFIVFDQTPITDGSLWVTFRLEGIWIEMSMQSIRAQHVLINKLSTGQTTDHRLFVMADAIAHALPLRSKGNLAYWQRQLTTYPDKLQRILILDASEAWTFPLHIASCWDLSNAARFNFINNLLSDVHHLLRLIFATNRVWEPDWKRLSWRLGPLSVKPIGAADRIEGLLRTPMSFRARALLYSLILDALHLVPQWIDVSRSINEIQKSLKYRNGAPRFQGSYRGDGQCIHPKTCK